VQAAWRGWRATDPRTEAFRLWAQGVARRRGKSLFAMWRDRTDYQPRRIRTRSAQSVADATVKTGASAPV
jgi:hypothetical protein